MKFDLVFEGGGAKGIVFVGAVQEFEAQGHTGRPAARDLRRGDHRDPAGGGVHVRRRCWPP